MKSKIAGVALAAVVGVCAVGEAAERAEAAPVVIELYPSAFDANITYYSSDRVVSTVNIDPLDEASYSGPADINISSVFSNGLYNVSIIFDGTHDLGATPYYGEAYFDYSFNLNFSLDFDVFSAKENYFLYPEDFANTRLQYRIDLRYEDGFDTFRSYDGPADLVLGVFPTLSPVPLPASAPMFAAALFVLGGISYACRQMKASADKALIDA